MFLIQRLGTAHYFAGNLERAGELTERGLDLAEALGLPENLCRGWNTKAMLIGTRRPEEARGLYQLAADTALAHEAYLSACSGNTNLADFAFRRDQYAESLAYLEQALAIARRVGDRPLEWFGVSETTYALTMLGRWDEALARFAEIPDEVIGRESDVISPVTGILEIYLQRGQLGEARRLLGRYEKLARSGDVQVESCYLPGLAAVRIGEGDHSAGLVAAEQAFATREKLGITLQSVKFGFLHALEAARALGDEPKANELLEIVEALPPGLSAPFLEATAKRFRGHLAGADPGADRHFTAAAAQLRALELPFYLAVAQLEHGEWLSARGRQDDALLLFAEARETFEHLQAQPWLERVDAVAPGSPAEVLA